MTLVTFLRTPLPSIGLSPKPPLVDSLDLQAGVCVKEGSDERQGPAFEEVWGGGVGSQNDHAWMVQSNAPRTRDISGRYIYVVGGRQTRFSETASIFPIGYFQLDISASKPLSRHDSAVASIRAMHETEYPENSLDGESLLMFGELFACTAGFTFAGPQARFTERSSSGGTTAEGAIAGS